MSPRPDILLIISDDHRWCDIGACGNSDVRTPNLDRLAAEGMRFERYYTPSPICAPARMALYSGVFPVRNGGWPNHSKCYPGTRSVVHHLGALGYRVGLSGKRHFGPADVFPFEDVADIEEFMSRDPTHPFCLVIATREPHAPWGQMDRECFDPERLTLAPNLVDTPETRRALARYYTCLSRLDAKIGEALRRLDRSGRPGNTITIYTSDHGAQFPGGKWTCYEPGLRVPFILRWPTTVKGGTVSSELVQHVDVLPTLIAAADGIPKAIDTGRPNAPDGGCGFDGESFLPLLRGARCEHRRFVYGVSTQHGTINGIPYAVRSVSDGRCKYILNLCHESEYSNALTGPADPHHENLYWQDWLREAEDDAQAALLVGRYLHRPPEELYDLQDDPWELDNRVDDAALADVRASLARQLMAWMKQQGDLGVETELAALSRQC